MEIREITDKKAWDAWVTSQPDYTFLQSWNWGEFNRQMGEKVWRTKETGQIISVSAKRGKFLFLPHGPVPAKRAQEYLVKLAKNNGDSFIRISPWVEDSPASRAKLSEMGFRGAPSIMHAEETWLLPLNKSDEELLAGMDKTHRNLVRRAEREGVEIEKIDKTKVAGGEIKDKKTGMRYGIEELYRLQLEAAKRHGFVPFSKKYLETEFEIFSKDGEAALFLGKHGGQVLAAAIIIFYGQFAFYFQSGSTESKTPVNYLLQWEVIKEAKRRGCEVYNFWGVTAENKGNASGLFTFKSGFGGFQKNYLHAQDLVLSPKYWVTYALEKVPRRWREILRRTG